MLEHLPHLLETLSDDQEGKPGGGKTIHISIPEGKLEVSPLAKSSTPRMRPSTVDACRPRGGEGGSPEETSEGKYKKGCLKND